MGARGAEKDVPGVDGYDWLLNHCVDLDQADHAAHLDERAVDPECFHCEIGAGRPSPRSPR